MNVEALLKAADHGNCEEILKCLSKDNPGNSNMGRQRVKVRKRKGGEEKGDEEMKPSTEAAAEAPACPMRRRGAPPEEVCESCQG